MPTPTLLLKPSGSRDRRGTVTPTLGGSAVAVTGQHGQAWRLYEGAINYCGNPSAETNTTGWAQSASATLDRTNTDAYVGSWAFRLTSTAAGQGLMYGNSTLTRPTVTGGQTWTAQARVKAPAGVTYVLRLDWRDAANAAIGLNDSVTMTGNGDWQFVTVTAPATATATYFQPSIRVLTFAAAGQVVLADAIQFEPKTYPTPYLDGSLGTGHSWASTAHGSNSTRTSATWSLPLSGQFNYDRGTILIRATPDYLSPGTLRYPQLMYIQPSTGVRPGFQSFIVDPPGVDSWYLSFWNVAGVQQYARAGAPTDELPAYFIADWTPTTYGQQVTGADRTETARVNYAAGEQFSGTLTLGGSGTWNSTIESMLVFDEALTPGQVSQLVDSPYEWNWDYVNHLLGSDVRLIPTMLPDGTPSQGPTGQGGEITYRGRFYAADRDNTAVLDISDYVLGGTIDTDLDRDVQSTIKLQTTDPSHFDAWSWVSAYVEITEENGNMERQQVGLFRMEQPKVSGNESDTVFVDASGLDVLSVARDYAFENTYNIAKGTNTRTALIALFAMVGLTRVTFPLTTKTTPKALSYKPGDPITRAINDLCAMNGWYASYATRDGRPTSRVFRQLNKSVPVRTYTLGVDSELVGDIEIDRKDDDFANVVVITSEDPALGVLRAVSRNQDPRSKHSTTYPGGPGVVTKTISVSNIDDPAVLQAMAHEERRKRSIVVSCTIRTLPDPTLTVHDTVKIVVDTELYPHLAEANGEWYVNQISYGFSPSSAVQQLRLRRSETPNA